MYQYYYKYCVDEDAYYIYLDALCTIFVGKYFCITKQDSFLNDLSNIVLTYKGEI